MARKSFDPEAILAAIARGERSCGDFEMRIDREGTWHYRGSPIGRLPLVKLFATVLRRGPDGGYWLVTPAEQGRIEVEDVPFVAVELRAEGEGRDQRVKLRTNLDEWVPLDADHPLRLEPAGDGAAVPYLRVQDQLDARVMRPVFYHMVDLAEPAPDGVDGVVGVWSAGQFFPLGSVDE
jgi:hypothetical protein